MPPRSGYVYLPNLQDDDCMLLCGHVYFLKVFLLPEWCVSLRIGEEGEQEVMWEEFARMACNMVRSSNWCFAVCWWLKFWSPWGHRTGQHDSMRQCTVKINCLGADCHPPDVNPIIQGSCGSAVMLPFSSVYNILAWHRSTIANMFCGFWYILIVYMGIVLWPTVTQVLAMKGLPPSQKEERGLDLKKKHLGLESFDATCNMSLILHPRDRTFKLDDD